MPVVATMANASASAYGFGPSTAGYPDYMWVAVGDSGNLYTSTDVPTGTMTWTSRTSSFGTTYISHVASSGARFVAAGHGGKIATSDDGTTWTQRTSSFGTSDVYSVGYGNGEWVALGGNDKMAYSTDDGVTWTQFSVTNFIHVGFTSPPKYGGGYWVIGGTAGDLIYATSASGTWTRVQFGTTTLSSGTNVYAEYLTGSSLWVIGINSGTSNAMATATAPNGTWTQRSLAVSSGSLVGGGLVANTSTIVVSTETLTPTLNFQSSTNGTSWTDRTPVDTSSSVGMSMAVDNSDRFLALKDKTTDTSEYSTDGATWSAATAAPFTSVGGLCHSEPIVSAR